jgi:hypothetical protein
MTYQLQDIFHTQFQSKKIKKFIRYQIAAQPLKLYS